MIAYRRDIDGLRAIAVLSVVAYHAVPAGVPGGYIGVDVFFVISGYLITKLIAADIERRRFSVAAFYVRRTKRIFPVLFVVLFTTLVMAWYLLTPTELKGLGRTTAATAGFVSNVAFWQDTGYFDTSAESKPLLHTWSLAVEEQFYVLWPLTLLALYRRRHVRAVLWALAALSFVMSCYFTTRHQPTAFFLLPTRAWELLVGAALALGLLPAIATERRRNVVAVIGLASIAAGLLLLDDASPFPGWNALAPCLGAALIIAAGEGGDNAVSRRLLSQPPLVFVGLISYSLYLWHWPLLSLARIAGRGHVSTATALIVVAVAVAMSVLTWRFVEVPFRARSVTPAARPVLVRYALLSVCALAAGLYVYATDGFLKFANPAVRLAEAARYDVNPMSGACLRWQAATGPLPSAECLSNEERFTRRLVIWGDSHADAVAPALVSFGASQGYATHQLTMAGCPPLIGAEVRGQGADYSPCTAFNRQVLEYVTGDPAVEGVVLSARWTLYTENARFGDDPGPITYLADHENRELSSAASKRVFARALESTIATLRRAGLVVIALGTIPPLGVNVPDCLARNQMPFSGDRSCDADSATVLAHLEFADTTLERAAERHAGVCSYLPQRAICPNGRCLAIYNGEILYANDDHLSLRGAAFLSRFFAFDNCLGLARARLGAETPPRYVSSRRNW